ncbi:MAG: ABC transporter permease [Verrucomicrobiota bacterium]
MLAFVLRRLLIALPVLLAVLIATFLLTRLMPGNPFSQEREITPAILQAIEERYNLDGNLFEQTTSYLGGVLHGDLGLSTQYRKRTVNEILAQTVPVSMTLGGIALALALFFGVTLGVMAAVWHNRPADRLAMLAALVGISVPNFVVGPLLVLAFAILIPLLPTSGWGSPAQVVLPAICLSIPYIAYIARLTRASMLETLGQDFVRTARAKGLAERRVVFKHALKVGILPVVTYCGPLAAAVLTGGIVVETIFAIPGMGPFFVNSILNKDPFMIGGMVLVYSTLLILFNLLVDIAYFLLDRRVKLA